MFDTERWIQSGRHQLQCGGLTLLATTRATVWLPTCIHPAPSLVSPLADTTTAAAPSPCSLDAVTPCNEWLHGVQGPYPLRARSPQVAVEALQGVQVAAATDTSSRLGLSFAHLRCALTGRPPRPISHRAAKVLQAWQQRHAAMIGQSQPMRALVWRSYGIGGLGDRLKGIVYGRIHECEQRIPTNADHCRPTAYYRYSFYAAILSKRALFLDLQADEGPLEAAFQPLLSAAAPAAGPGGGSGIDWRATKHLDLASVKYTRCTGDRQCATKVIKRLVAGGGASVVGLSQNLVLHRLLEAVATTPPSAEWLAVQDLRFSVQVTQRMTCSPR